MHNSRWLPLVLALLLGIAAAAEVDAGSESVLTLIEVRVEMRGHAGNSLRQQADAAREQQGSTGQIVMMQEIARPERFVVLERGAAGVLAAGGMSPRTCGFGAADILESKVIVPEILWKSYDAASTPAASGSLTEFSYVLR
jgi:hypothetical protein